MHVLHYNTAFGWRGGEQQISYLVKGLADYPVRQFAAGQPDEPFLHQISGFVEESFSMPSRGEISPFAVKKLIAILRHKKIDIVHTHSTPAHALALQAKHIYGHFKLVVHRRVDFRIKNNPVSLYKYKSRKVDKIIAISLFIKNLLLSQGIPESKITVIYSGIDVERFRQKPTADIRDEFQINKETRLIGNVAALTGHKDHSNLIRAMKIVEDQGVDFKLIVVGEGKEKGRIENEINNLGLKNRIVLTGFREDPHNLLHAFDLQVHSSKDEGLGTSIIDALAVGIPVVATDAGGIPEILGNSEYGLIVPRMNPTALAEGILRVLRESDLMKRYKRSGPERAKEFSVKAMIEKTYHLYKDIMNLS